MIKWALGCLAIACCFGAAADEPHAPVWVDDPGKMEVPNHPVSGRVNGVEFKPDSVVLKGGVFTMSQGKKGPFPELAIDLMMFVRQDEEPAGKTWTVRPGDPAGKVPFVRLQARKGKRIGPMDSTDIPAGYAMKVELGRRDGDRIAGKIYICLPDKEKSVAAGTFVLVGAEKGK